MSDSDVPPPAGTGWFVVSQVKSDRVVYFTDDPHYQPPTAGDWYYVSHYAGPLPEGMSLRNCWGWRFDGHRFLHAGDPTPETAARRLVDANRRALRELLRTRIDEMRRPWAPSSLLGETLRAAKLAEARALRAGAAPADADDAWPLLRGVAAARRLTLPEAASLILERNEATRRALIESEGLRERFAAAIDVAMDDAELLAVRAQLLDQVVPAEARHLPPPPYPMTPEDWDRPLGDAERLQEAGNLRAQLRASVNARRRRVHDGYLDNEGLVKHKAKLAQAILNNGGAVPAGTDASMLEGFAAARRLPLADAARLVIGTVTEAEGILRQTEREKDRLSARIDAAQTLRDFHRVKQEIDALGPGPARI
jgi:hypothetical protein